MQKTEKASAWNGRRKKEEARKPLLQENRIKPLISAYRRSDARSGKRGKQPFIDHIMKTVRQMVPWARCIATQDTQSPWCLHGSEEQWSPPDAFIFQLTEKLLLEFTG